MRSIRTTILAALLGLAACGSLGYHQVRTGDTLRSVALTYGYDVGTLAQWNHLAPPYALTPGQWLRVAPPDDAPAAAPAPGGTPPPPTAAAPRETAPPVRTRVHAARLTWEWPVHGRLLTRFAAGRPAGKGVDIAGRPGDPVRAAAAGRVIYSGSGLIGYGKLVIIKHNQHFLSTYAYNRRLFVKEGDTVAMGDEIAEMGGPGPGQGRLYFEIRRDGDPVDPLDYLPGGGARR